MKVNTYINLLESDAMLFCSKKCCESFYESAEPPISVEVVLEPINSDTEAVCDLCHGEFKETPNV